MGFLSGLRRPAYSLLLRGHKALNYTQSYTIIHDVPSKYTLDADSVKNMFTETYLNSARTPQKIMCVRNDL